MTTAAAHRSALTGRLDVEARWPLVGHRWINASLNGKTHLRLWSIWTRNWAWHEMCRGQCAHRT